MLSKNVNTVYLPCNTRVFFLLLNFREYVNQIQISMLLMKPRRPSIELFESEEKENWSLSVCLSDDTLLVSRDVQ